MVFRGFSGTQSRAVAYEIAAVLRQARGTAVSENTDVAVVFDIGRNIYGIERKKPGVLAENLRLALYAAQSEQLSADVGAIRYPLLPRWQRDWRPGHRRGRDNELQCGRGVAHGADLGGRQGAVVARAPAGKEGLPCSRCLSPSPFWRS